jgi:hypothetical protein
VAEKIMTRNVCRRLLPITLVVSAWVVPGCAKDTSKQAVDKAEKVVETFLDAWSRGESPDKFADANQPIQGSDPDWKAGLRLLSFLTVDSKQSQDDPHYFLCRMTLSLQDRRGKKLEKQVVYGVHLGEKNTLERAAAR